MSAMVIAMLLLLGPGEHANFSRQDQIVDTRVLSVFKWREKLPTVMWVGAKEGALYCLRCQMCYWPVGDGKRVEALIVDTAFKTHAMFATVDNDCAVVTDIARLGPKRAMGCAVWQESPGNAKVSGWFDVRPLAGNEECEP